MHLKSFSTSSLVCFIDCCDGVFKEKFVFLSKHFGFSKVSLNFRSSPTISRIESSETAVHLLLINY